MSRTPINIMLFEDNPGNARLVHAMMHEVSSNRISIMHVDHLSSALKLLGSRRPDVILLNMPQPESNGREAFITTQEDSPTSPITTMSGLENETIAMSAIKEGGRNYIVDGLDEGHMLKKSIRDSIERKKTKEEVLQAHQTMQVILDSMPYGVFIVGKDKALRYVNAAALKLTENPVTEDFVGKTCSSVFCMQQFCDCPLVDPMHAIFQEERTLITTRGKHTPVMRTIIPVELKTEELLLVSFVDITDIKDAEQKLVEHEKQLEYLTHHDTLTGLPNRIYFNKFLADNLVEAKGCGHPLAIMLLDLDHFKTLNDSFGHSNGDLLLKLVANRVKDSLRKSDIVARLGGDEFIVLLPCIENQNDVIRIAAKLKNSIEEPFVLGKEELYITTSIGITMFPGDGDGMDSLVKNAEIALYRAKEEGRNRYQFYTPEMQGCAREKMVLKNSLHKALERNEFILHYQPQIDLQTGRLVGMEALIRWQHHDLGLIPPLKFISIAEESGLIIPIGEWVLSTACRQNMMWRKAGYNPGSVAVNLSVLQFRQNDIVESVARVLKDTSMAAADLELEITESSLIFDVDNAVSTLQRLHELGVRISIDDFGTGYSSLEYLKKLPIYTLKIDRSFIREITNDPDDKAIVRAIIAMAHSMRLKVVAEGVEVHEQLVYLHSLGCNMVQGYFFSRPLPPQEMSALLEQDPVWLIDEGHM